MSFAGRAAQLIDALASYQAPDVFNPWRDVDAELDLRPETPAAPIARRARLTQHLRSEPRFVLIGEAPGYRGCRFAGVPFASEALIFDGVVPRVTMGQRITTLERPLAEASATIVWRTLYTLGLEDDVVMWNAFPFHPHKPGKPLSNRTPTAAEVCNGAGFLSMLLELYPDARVLPVGRVAAQAIAFLGKRAEEPLRHPSMGGAQLFAAGLRAAAGAK